MRRRCTRYPFEQYLERYRIWVLDHPLFPVISQYNYISLMDHYFETTLIWDIHFPLLSATSYSNYLYLCLHLDPYYFGGCHVGVSRSFIGYAT